MLIFNGFSSVSEAFRLNLDQFKNGSIFSGKILIFDKYSSLGEFEVSGSIIIENDQIKLILLNNGTDIDLWESGDAHYLYLTLIDIDGVDVRNEFICIKVSLDAPYKYFNHKYTLNMFFNMEFRIAKDFKVDGTPLHEELYKKRDMSLFGRIKAILRL